jgi:16S rRNA (cytosine1402-N4)-methyltransferase
VKNEADRYIHEPVLLEEVVEYLQPARENAEAPSVMVDATVGEGGHAEAFLSRFPQLYLYCVDADSGQLDRARARLARFSGRVEFINIWFSAFFSGFSAGARRSPDRILFDLGISSRHYEEGGRGFSFQKDEPLDMRLGAGRSENARDIVNTWSEPELAQLFATRGEERYARQIARAVGVARRKKAIETSGELEKIIWGAVPETYRRRGIHPATRVFQALRIETNKELDELEQGLEQGFSVLKPRGRMGVISFHSLEDRIVKNFFKEKNKTCTCPPEVPICQCGGKRKLELLTKKPLGAGQAEVIRNPRSRSAKFRVGEKCV